MRTKLIATLIVLMLSVGICAFSMGYVNAATDRMNTLSSVVLEYIELNDTERAREALAQMATVWERAGPWLRCLVPHEDLHSVIIQYVEAATNLEADDLSDFMRSMALLVESLKHLREHEALTLSNIL